MRKSSPKDFAFNDGYVDLYQEVNVAPEGEWPQPEYRLIERLSYRERTVGYRRYWTAQEHQVEINRVIRCPRPPDRSVNDVVTDAVTALSVAVFPNGQAYNVIQVQHPEDIVPRVMDLSLTVRKERWEVEDVNR